MRFWDPGRLGGRALAKLIFGDVSPSGKLPVTFYKSADLLPDIRDYSMKGRTYRYCTPENVLYPFGRGLSYAEFSFTQADATAEMAAVTIANLSDIPAEDVIQVYVRGFSEEDVPNGSLCGFARVSLRPHEEKRVEIPLPRSAFETVLADGTRKICGTKFEIRISDGAGAELRREITI